MRRLLNRIVKSDKWIMVVYFVAPFAMLALALMLAGALLFGCTPPRTVEHAPDIATETR